MDSLLPRGMEDYCQARRKAIENATLLWSAREIVEKPSENALLQGDETRSLPISREAQLADDFAFIAANRDDPNQVMAVCIEEVAEKDSIIVRVASNTGNLENVVHGLQTIADSMITANSRASLYTNRIDGQASNPLALEIPTCRKDAEDEREEKSPFIAPTLLLLQTIKECQSMCRNKEVGQRISGAEGEVSNLWHMFKKFEVGEARGDKITSLELLKNVLTAICRFDVKGLEEAISHNSKLNPSTKDYLPTALRKLSRYFEVATNLTNAARSTRYRLFSTITVAPVACNNITSLLLGPGLKDFDHTLSRITGLSSRDLSGATMSRAALRKRYSDRISSSQTGWKVHAEVQILLFYELHPMLPRPRVICSSKSACFLCNLFLQLHGQFQTPRTHGRLYEKWTLPCWTSEQSEMIPTITPIIERFNNALEIKILEVLRQRMLQLNHPNESAVVDIAPWSSVSTVVRSHAEVTAESDPLGRRAGPIENQDDEALSALSVSETSSELANVRDTLANVAAEDVCDHERNCWRVIEDSDITIMPASETRLKTRLRGGMPVQITTDGIEVLLSEVAEEPAASAGENQRSCCVIVGTMPHLSFKTKDTGAAQLVDIDALRPGCDTVVSVGAALACNRIVLTRGSREMSLEFEFMENPCPSIVKASSNRHAS